MALYYPQANQRRPLILVGPPSIGRHELRLRLLEDTSRFNAAVPRKAFKQYSIIVIYIHIHIKRPSEMVKNTSSKVTINDKHILLFFITLNLASIVSHYCVQSIRKFFPFWEVFVRDKNNIVEVNLFNAIGLRLGFCDQSKSFQCHSWYGWYYNFIRQYCELCILI